MYRWTEKLAGRFLRDQHAVSGTEYAILLGLIVLVAMASIRAIGEKMYTLYLAIDGTMATN